MGLEHLVQGIALKAHVLSIIKALIPLVQSTLSGYLMENLLIYGQGKTTRSTKHYFVG